ncbi:MAG: hypothetical protein NTV49_01195 [Kiritimatiellaeota bacterium]|nr:hypothetical protein [Kiritimatiellota bacterium]
MKTTSVIVSARRLAAAPLVGLWLILTLAAVLPAAPRVRADEPTVDDLVSEQNQLIKESFERFQADVDRQRLQVGTEDFKVRLQKFQKEVLQIRQDFRARYVNARPTGAGAAEGGAPSGVSQPAGGAAKTGAIAQPAGAPPPPSTTQKIAVGPPRADSPFASERAAAAAGRTELSNPQGGFYEGQRKVLSELNTDPLLQSESNLKAVAEGALQAAEPGRRMGSDPLSATQRQQLEALRAHGDPERAGVVQAGDTPERRAARINSLKQSVELTVRSEAAAAARRKAQALDQVRENFQESLAHATPADAKAAQPRPGDPADVQRAQGQLSAENMNQGSARALREGRAQIAQDNAVARQHNQDLIYDYTARNRPLVTPAENKKVVNLDYRPGGAAGPPDRPGVNMAPGEDALLSSSSRGRQSLGGGPSERCSGEIAPSEPSPGPAPPRAARARPSPGAR